MNDEIEILKKELASTKQKLKDKATKQAETIWEKIEIAYTDKPLYQAYLDAKNSADIMHLALNEFKDKFVQEQEAEHLSAGVTPQVSENLEKLTREVTATEKFCQDQLDNLAKMVNVMESHFKNEMPQHLQNISMTSDMTWASPTLLCLKLKEEYLNMQKEYEGLRSQLSEESNTYITANNSLKEQVRSLGHSVSDITAKYQREKDEKEKIMQLIQGQDKEAFDAIRFYSVLEDNRDLKRQIQNYKDQLIQEKHIKLNQLFDDQNAMGKILTLNQELNTLGNVKVELIDQIQAIRSANNLQLADKDRQIEFLKQQNKLVSDKLVTKI